MSKVDDTLKQIALEAERVISHEVAITDMARVPQLINDYAAKIKEIGMSPMKGFAMSATMRTTSIEQMLDQYRNNFLQRSRGKVEDGEWVKMCMQCGVCAGSCPFGPHWEHSPQKIFMMIRAGKREEVLSSHSMWHVHVLLQLHGALSAQTADHAHHARPGELRAPPRPRAEEPADARLLAAVLGELHQDRARQRAQDDHRRSISGKASSPA